MPVIRPALSEPTDLVMQGEQMRAAVFDSPVAINTDRILPGLQALNNASLVQDEDPFMPMNSFVETNRLSMRRQRNGITQVRANGGIATPCGVWVINARTPLLLNYTQATKTWTITGVTKDSTGAALGNCRVVCFETGRLAVGQSPVVAETISDGSGNYTVTVPTNTDYELIAYLPGSPDVAGITRNDISPV